MGNKGASYFVVVVPGGPVGAGWHPYRIDVFEFPKLQNPIHVSYVVLDVVCCAQESSVGINNENHREICWVTKARNITRTCGFTVERASIDVSCFLWREHLFKTQSTTSKKA